MLAAAAVSGLRSDHGPDMPDGEIAGSSAAMTNDDVARSGMSDQPEVLFERRGAAGIITLDRPQALNALTVAAVRAIRPRLAEWAADPAVTRVVIRSGNERAFSAGGDIRALHELHEAGRIDEEIDFWREEYQLNAEIKRFPKPYVALIDGIVMGGGVGLSLHGSHRVAGDRYLFAMPEVGIGFFPDVGSTFALPRLPGRAGSYLALTGARLGPGGAIALGLATHRVPSAGFVALLDALATDLDVAGTLAAFSIRPEASDPARARLIERAFGGESMEAIVEHLEREASGKGEEALFAQAQAAAIRTKSPLSLKIALEQMRRGPMLDFNEAMRTEFRIVNRIARGHDFYEGVRAAVLDKDNAPRWNPPRLEQVTAEMVESHFLPLPPLAEELPVP
jgi:enoyl-CoA hydratase